MSAHIIDKRGNIIYSAPKIGYTYFSEGLCRVIKEDSAGGYKCGYIDTTGKLVIPYQFDDADFFQGGVARVKKGDKWGLINSKGKLICPFYHSDKEDVPMINSGIIRKWDDDVNKDDAKLSYIDIEGNEVINTNQYSYISDFCNGYAVVQRNGNEHALINTKGEIVIPFGKYSSIGNVYCGVAEVSKYGKDYKSSYGYVNTTGVEVVPLGKYDHFYWHDPELSVVCAINGDTCGYIDKSTGQEVVPCAYKYNTKSTVAAISRGIYDDYKEISMFVIILKDHVYTSKNEICVYNTKIHKAYNLNDIDNIAYHYSEGLCAVEKNGKIGFIDETCKIVIPFKFPCPQDSIGVSLTAFREGVCAIGNKLIDKQGIVIKSFEEEEYHNLRYEGDGMYSISCGVGIALVNLKGNIIYKGFEAELNGPLNAEFPVAVVDKNLSYHNTWRFINKEGKSAFSYQFNEGYNYKNGFAVINETISKATRKTKPASSSIKSGSGCYIATAVYGSYDCPEVWTLRRYRDNVLDSTWYGRAFIRTYYAISPTLVKWFGKTDWFRSLLGKPLNKWVEKLNRRGFENTPYNDKY